MEKLLSNCRHHPLYVNIVLNVIVDLIPIGPETQKCDADSLSIARNFDAFEVILNIFTPYVGPLPPLLSGLRSPLKDKSFDIKTAQETEFFLAELIHGIMGLYASHQDNFEILESKYLLLGTLLKLTPLMVTTKLPDITIKMIEFIATALDVVPQETLHIFPTLLLSLNCLDRKFDKKHMYLTVKLIESMKTLISYRASYRQLLRETGLLNQIVIVLDQIHNLG